MQTTGGSSGCQIPPLFHSWQVRSLQHDDYDDVNDDEDDVDVDVDDDGDDYDDDDDATAGR